MWNLSPEMFWKINRNLPKNLSLGGGHPQKIAVKNQLGSKL